MVIAMSGLAVLIGLTLVYVAAFLYQSEQQRIQDLLEDAWLQLATQQDASLSKCGRFARKTAQLTSQGFDWLFGKRLISLRGVTVSLCLSASAVGYTAIVFDLWVVSPQPSTMETLLAVLYALCFLGFALASASRPSFTPFCLLLALAGVLGPASLEGVAFLFVTLVYAAASVTSVTFFIALTRQFIRQVERVSSVPRALMLVVIELGIACAAIAGPLFASARLYANGDASQLSYDFFLHLGAGNVALALPALAVVALAGTWLLHRAVAPLVNRPLYVLADMGIVQRKKLFLCAGIFLVGVGAPQMVPWLKILFVQ